MCIERALGYKHKIDFQRDNSGMYSACIRYGWWEDVTKHMVKKPNGVEKYVPERARELSKEVKRRGEFQKKYSGAYKYAKKHGMMDELFPSSRTNPLQLQLELI